MFNKNINEYLQLFNECFDYLLPDHVSQRVVFLIDSKYCCVCDFGVLFLLNSERNQIIHKINTLVTETIRNYSLKHAYQAGLTFSLLRIKEMIRMSVVHSWLLAISYFQLIS